jgi:hypothetical protein
MLVTNLFSEGKDKEETGQDEPEYPDEVLESGWIPVLTEVHSRIISEEKSNDSASKSKEDVRLHRKPKST